MNKGQIPHVVVPLLIEESPVLSFCAKFGAALF